MNHNITSENYGIRFRPVKFEDAEFIVNLRNSPRAIGKIGDSAITIEQQCMWIEKYLERDNDYYFMVESISGKPLGTYSIYDFNSEMTSAEVGRWVMIPGVPAAIPCACLGLDIAFYRMNLKEVRGATVESNLKVVSFHRELGFSVVGISQGDRVINSKPVNMVLIKLRSEKWEENRKNILPLVSYAAKILEKM